VVIVVVVVAVVAVVVAVDVVDVFVVVAAIGFVCVDVIPTPTPLPPMVADVYVVMDGLRVYVVVVDRLVGCVSCLVDVFVFLFVVAAVDAVVKKSDEDDES